MNIKRTNIKTGFLLLATILFLAACGGGGGDGGDGEAPAPTGPTSRLYVSGFGNGTLLSYDNADSISGTAPVSRTVGGAATNMNSPVGIQVDMPNNRLYVANSGANSILVFDNATTANGNITPSRTIAGAATTLLDPEFIFLDRANDRLYVANNGNDAILVFDNASTANGDITPSRAITPPAGSFQGVYVDTTRDKLYVVDAGFGNAILVFDNASTANGNITPSRTIAGPATTLLGPQNVFVDVTTNRLYVANELGNAILVFNNASTANGDIAPTRTISGAATTFNFPTDVFVDMANDKLYVANLDGNSILVFNNASTASGNVGPDRTITLPAGTFPIGVFVDLTPMVLPSQAALDGVAQSDGVANAAGDCPFIGDFEQVFPGDGFRQFYSFDISMIPPTAKVVSATLRLFQANVVGQPYTDLGNVIADHVNYGPSLDGGDYNGGTITSNIGTLSTNATIEYKTLDVTSRVQSDVATGQVRTQYRLRFTTDFNNDGNNDLVFFSDAEGSCDAFELALANPPQLVIRVVP